MGKDLKDSNEVRMPLGESSSVVVDSLAPINRPMQQATSVIPKVKKHKTKLFISIAVAAIVLIVGITTAAILLNFNKKDSVVAAITKILDGDIPDNMVIDGSIELAVDVPYSMVSKVKVSFNSKLRSLSPVNSSSATITASIRNAGDITVQVDEMYASGDDLFFRISGATNAIEDSGMLYLLNMENKAKKIMDCGDNEACQPDDVVTEEAEQCSDNEECDTTNELGMGPSVLTNGDRISLDEETLAFVDSLIGVIESIDGEWVRISVDELGSFVRSNLFRDDLNCIVALADSIYVDRHTMALFYDKYPFITSANDNPTIQSIQYAVHKLEINSEDFVNFVNSIHDTALSEQIYACLNLESGIELDKNEISDIIERIPDLYTEIDDDDNFTRLRFDTTIAEGAMSVDLNFTYPVSISIPEPLEYQDFSDVIQNVSIDAYEMNTKNDPGAEQSAVDN